MPGKPVVVEFFYDVTSPYSYFGFEIICRYKPIWNIDLKLKPACMSEIMKRTGNKPPAVLPAKGVYISEEFKRVSKFYQVPMVMSETTCEIIMNGGDLDALKYVTAVDIVKPEYLVDMSRASFKRFFEKTAESISMEKDTIAKCLELMNSNEVKQRLDKNTEEALDYGAFGLPWSVFHINNKLEALFGSDRFELMAFMLGEKYMGPVPE